VLLLLYALELSTLEAPVGARGLCEVRSVQCDGQTKYEDDHDDRLHKGRLRKAGSNPASDHQRITK
jgi:hypothetical protein